MKTTILIIIPVLLIASINSLLVTHVHRQPFLKKQNALSDIESNMVLIPGGTFMMGTDSTEIYSLMKEYSTKRFGIFEGEIPKHQVSVDSFYMDKYEVTNAEFKEFVDANPEWSPKEIKPEFHNGSYLKNWNGNDYTEGEGDYPVIYVSWYAAFAYSHWKGKRLPTEAEWEFASRGGLIGREFPWGDSPPDSSKANYSETNIGQVTRVGSYAPNDYGLYDMAGNAWEFCLDEYKSYNPAPSINPVAGGTIQSLNESFKTITTRRVIRGGSWGAAALNLRCSYRDSHPPDGCGNHVGFRCVVSRKN
jgi:sulfatase modifying factor 1